MTLEFWNKTPWRDWYIWPDKPPVIYVQSSDESAGRPTPVSTNESSSMSFYARFVDERGKPIGGFAGKFEHSADPERTVSFSESDFAEVHDVVGASSAWLRLPDDANSAIIDELKQRWNEIRGRRDDAWRAAETRLLELQFTDGKPPSLKLDAEAKHTFVLEPRVVLAKLSGMYFDSYKCFLLPTACPSLRELVQIYEANPTSEILIVGHADTTGQEKDNLRLSGERADAMKAYLTDDADAWLAWYGEDKAQEKRWGDSEDMKMIESLVPEEQLSNETPIKAYQRWHNHDTEEARMPGQPRSRPDGWEELEVDGVMGPKTRRQLILDYMNLDGTSLDDDTRVVTYGAGASYPVADFDDEPTIDAADATDTTSAKGKQVDRRVEIFFFARPFGILPQVPEVPDEESSHHATLASDGDGLYPEWRSRVLQMHSLGVEEQPFRLRLCNYDLIPYAQRPFAFCLDGLPEVRGTTDKDGFAILDTPPSGANGYVKVWPDDAVPDDEVRWDITIGPIAPARTALGASTRLANLDYFQGSPTSEMTDELSAAICDFQFDTDGLEINGTLDADTTAKLREIHDCV
jgi:outer membrane protein OmpA-like peptidoglycan-associated protein